MNPFLHVVEELPNVADADLEWVIVGKGPSISRWHPGMNEKFNVVSINQAALITRSRFVAHIDYEPFIGVSRCYEGKTSQTVIVPWVPHWRERSGHGNLETYCRFDPMICALRDEGRLLSYDLRTTDERHWPDREVIRAYASTTEAVVHILALCGIRKIFTLGIDGGKSRASVFANSYRTHEGDYSLQDYGLNLLKEKYKLEVVKL